MSFWVYILRCSDGTYYTGQTDDLEHRIAQHQAGTFLGYTHDRRPVELMFSETFTDRIDALDRDSVNPSAHFKDMVGWNRRALRVVVPPMASQEEVAAAELLCAIAATRFVRPVAEANDTQS